MLEKNFRQNVEKVCVLIKYAYIRIKFTIIVHLIHQLSNKIFGKVLATRIAEIK